MYLLNVSRGHKFISYMSNRTHQLRCVPSSRMGIKQVYRAPRSRLATPYLGIVSSEGGTPQGLWNEQNTNVWNRTHAYHGGHLHTLRIWFTMGNALRTWLEEHNGTFLRICIKYLGLTFLRIVYVTFFIYGSRPSCLIKTYYNLFS